jgi:hypothetical protein
VSDGTIRLDYGRRVLCYVRFVKWIPQLDVSVTKFSTGRDTDGIFNSNVTAAQRAAVY